MRSDCRWIWSFFRDDENIPELENLCTTSWIY
jgi:hypothetical protein